MEKICTDGIGWLRGSFFARWLHNFSIAAGGTLVGGCSLVMGWGDVLGV